MALITVNNLTFGYDGSCDNIFEQIRYNKLHKLKKAKK